MRNICELDNLYNGQPLQVVGSGASLMHLTPNHFVSGPVVAINYAITVVEGLGLSNPLYSMQKDHVYQLPQSAALLLHTRESASEIDGNATNIYLFDAESDFGAKWYNPSVVCAVGLAKRMGCSEVIYHCCDSAYGITQKYQLGEVITPDNAEDYLLHPILVDLFAKKLEIPVQWQPPIA